LSARDVIGLVHALPSSPIGADVVEFNPGQDPPGLTAHVAAKLLKELAGKMLRA
jgi:arginase family enzyme